MIALMATRTRIGPRRPRRVFHKQWRELLGYSLQYVADRLGESGIPRGTVQRWEKEPWRLDPGIMAALAEIYGIEPQDLWRQPPAKPQGPSVDQMLEDAPDDMRATVQDFVARILKRS
jgi:transcriptional regulator with XRE-family HTH domain